MLNALFFTEGGREHGYGHLTRCKALFDEFSAGGMETRLLVTGDPTVSAMLDEGTYTLCDWTAEEPRPCDIAVVDSSRATPELCARMAEKAGVILFIDDSGRADYPPASVVLDGSLTAQTDPLQNDSLLYLRGPKYQPVRQDFIGEQKTALPDKPRSVLITFGGNDARNLSPLALKVLTEHFPELEKNVAVGKSFVNGPEMAKYTDPKTLFFYAPGAAEMAQLMNLSDFAVCSAGQTLFELASCCTPAAVIGISDNRDQNIKGWLDAGFITFAGWHDDADIEINLLHAINALVSPGAAAEKAGRGYYFINPRAAHEILTYLTGLLAKKRGL